MLQSRFYLRQNQQIHAARENWVTIGQSVRYLDVTSDFSGVNPFIK